MKFEPAKWGSAFLAALLLGGASATLSTANEPTNVWDAPWRYERHFGPKSLSTLAGVKDDYRLRAESTIPQTESNSAE